MRWLLLASGLIAAIIVIVLLVGALLPVAHTASRSAAITAPAERVWAALTDVAAFPTWRSDVTSVDRLSTDSWREHGKHGTITYQVTASQPPSRLVVRIADKTLPFGGEWEYTIAPGTITIVERGEIYNPVFRVMARYVFGYTATIDAYLTSLTGYLNGR